MKTFTFFLVLLSAIFFLISCNGVDLNKLKNVRDKLTTPKQTFEILRLAIKYDKIDIFYYCLAREIRDEYSYGEIVSAWDEVKRKIHINPDKVQIVKIENSLSVSPFPNYPAACITAKYTDEKGVTKTERLLFLKQQDPDYEEKNQNWRVYYPFEQYQGFDALPVTKKRVETNSGKQKN